MSFFAPSRPVFHNPINQGTFKTYALFHAGLGAHGVATPAPRAPVPPGKVNSWIFRHQHCPTSAVKNDAHLKKETTVRTEFGGAHDRGAFAGGLIEGKTLKGAHLNLPAFHLAGNLDNFPLHLE